MHPSITTLGALKETGYQPRSIRDELRENLVKALRAKTPLFPGIVGYEKTVTPQLINALLSRHDLILLGLRGQAKTRILRSLSQFLDEWVPIVKGSSLNEDPLAPVTRPTQNLLAVAGDEAPIEWLHRSQRFQEKLATPDVSMADLIGDIDPIKASREKLDLADERVIHYGIIPRTNRGIFCLNELPDLQARIQVGLLNILEERDLQIRGFPVRLSLDILLVFSANPEDYTNRGSIITPLKDRIGSQIITHYPRNIEDSLRITAQEAHIAPALAKRIPRLFREVIEEIAVQARKSEHVDQSSGVSARLSISALELLAGNMERRQLLTGEEALSPRLCDLLHLIPAITGKVELVYEGEQEGPSIVAERLIGKAVRAVFDRTFPAVRHGKKEAEPTEPLYSRIINWFNRGKTLEITDFRSAAEERRLLLQVDGLPELAAKYLQPVSPEEETAAMELALEGLHQHSALSREGIEGAVIYGDMFRQMMTDL